MNRRMNLLVLFVLWFVYGMCQACVPPYVDLYIPADPCPGCDLTITAQGWDGSAPEVPGISISGDYTLISNTTDSETGTRTMVVQYSQGGNFNVSASGSEASSQGTTSVQASESSDRDIDVGGGSCEDPSDDNPDTPSFDICTCGTTDVTYDSSIFTVTQNGGGNAGNTTYTVSLAQPASTLTEREMNAVVKFSTGEIVRLRRASEDLDSVSPIGGLSRPLDRSCSSCSGGNNKLNFYGMSAVVATRMEDTLGNQSVYLGEVSSNVPDVKINVGGKMFRVANRKNWSTDEYELGGNIGYEVTAPDGTVYLYYKSGASLTAGDELFLRYIYRPVSSSETETITLHYDGNTLDYQEDEDGNKIDYVYNGRLTKLRCYDNSPSVQDYDREIQFEYDPYKRLWKTYCASCGSNPQKYFSYTSSEELYYVESMGTNLPLKRRPSAVVDSQLNTRSQISYGSQDRMTQAMHYGNAVNKWVYEDEPAFGNPYVIKKDYVDSTDCRVTVYFYDVYGTGVLESKREYHDVQTEAVSSIDDIGDLNGEDYSETTYATSVTNDVKTVTTTLPSGDRIIEEYDLDDNGHLMCKYRENSTGTEELVLGEYDYSEYGTGSGNYLLDSFHLPRYGTGKNQVYIYDSSNDYKLTKEIAPEVEIGANAAATQKITHTKFDDLGRIKYKFSSTSSGWVGTEYTYDSYGNRDLVKNGCVFTIDGSDVVTNVNYSNAVITDYDYNAYNQLVQVATQDGSDDVNVRKYYYDDDGVKIGEAAMLDDNDTYAISAEKYTYDSEGRMIIKSVVMANQEFSKTTLESDLEVELSLAGTGDDEVDGFSGLGLTWIHTVYGFDSYGDQVFVVQDAKQYNESSPPVERKHLKTSYKYNYLGEVVMTRNSDDTGTEIVRDGRGMVKERKSGYYDGGTFDDFEAVITIEYTYDANGNLKTTKEPHPSGNGDQVITVNEYDVFDRLVGTHKELLDN